jgi:hypothetical protein
VPKWFCISFPASSVNASHSWESHYFGTFVDGTIISMYVQDYPPSLVLLLVGMVNPVCYPFYAPAMLCRRVHIKHARYILFAAITLLWL